LKTFLRIFTLFIISQLFSLGFLFVISDLPFESIVSLNEIDTFEYIDNFGLKPYLFYSQLFSVLIPTLVYFVIYHRDNLKNWVKTYLPKNKAFFTYGIMFLFLAYPLIQLSADLNKFMPFADLMSDQSGMIEKLMKDILKMDNLSDLLFNIVLIGLLPAIGEELFFRAGIQNELVENMKNKNIAIIVTAIIFSAFHLQFDGFLPRFFLGLILGYLYYWSRSIWLSILIHFINNSMLVISVYFMQEKIENLNLEETQKLPMHIVLMSIVAVLVLRHKLLALSKETDEELSVLDNS